MVNVTLIWREVASPESKVFSFKDIAWHVCSITQRSLWHHDQPDMKVKYFHNRLQHERISADPEVRYIAYGSHIDFTLTHNDMTVVVQMHIFDDKLDLNVKVPNSMGTFVDAFDDDETDFDENMVVEFENPLTTFDSSFRQKYRDALVNQ